MPKKLTKTRTRRLLKPVGSAGELLERIREYLTLGGLFNPELMEHDKVRDLIMDCREHITRTQPNAAGEPQPRKPRT